MLDGVFPTCISSLSARAEYSWIIKRDQSMSFTGSSFHLGLSGSCYKYHAQTGRVENARLSKIQNGITRVRQLEKQALTKLRRCQHRAVLEELSQ